MEDIDRHLESVVQEYANAFPIVLLTGARAVGKLSLLTRLFGELPLVSFADPTQVVSAKSDPKHFFSLITPPVILDEIQYITELFPYIKMEVDRRGAKGLYIMTGSQQYSLMQNVSESLAGRVGILVLHGLSLREQYGDTFAEPFVPSKEQILSRNVQYRMERGDLWKIIHRGSYPELVKGSVSRDMYYGSYVKTYIERDVRSLAQIGDAWQFTIFLTIVAARTGSIVNYTDIAKEVGVSSPPSSAGSPSDRRWHCHAAPPVVKEYREAGDEDSQALLPRHRVGQLAHQVAHAPVVGGGEYGRCLLRDLRCQ